MMTIEEQYALLEETIKKNTQGCDLERVRVAYEFAREAHGEQRRKDGQLYISHPIAAAEIIAEMGLDCDSIVGALLHDVIEDTNVTHEEIARKFGPSVAEMVEGVTKLTRVVYTSKEEEQMENMRKMLMAMAKDIRVILIKIADRLHNMRTMEYQKPAKQREKAFETMEIYAPIAYRLGMQRIKAELEDLSLKYLDPIGYKEIEENLEKKSEESVQFFEKTQEHIKKRLAQVGIESTVYGRIKQIYSIYRKMFMQNKEFSEVLDLYAFRVVVNSIADCYNVLGYIHEMYRPIPGRFKDYIGTPKPNMYQSLHTSVIGTEGVPFEVQIRTWDMHRTSEYGIAAHWKYKEGIQGKEDNEEKFAWIRSLLESQQELDAHDFLRTLKFDMFSDEVFVFTPNGDVKSLPAGATPIDFAYSIHSAIGNSMSGVTVNGRIVPFDHVLQNGDIVEVQTSKSSRGPSRDWLNIVKSSEARNKIRQWFKKEKRDENIAHGKLSFEAEIKRLGLRFSDIMSPDVLPQLLKKVSFPTLDEMYAAIGYGGASAHKMANRMREELRMIERAGLKDQAQSTSLPTPTAPKRQKAIHGIIVEGIDNCLTRFSRCCTPVPGDDVIGFVTRGYGVSVHRKDCQNYLDSIADESNPDSSRWIKVSWAPDTGNELYQTGISMTARERSALVLDIATILHALKLNMSSLSARDMGDGIATVFITLSVKNRDELATAIARLSRISGVHDIKRSGMKEQKAT